ncbi:MAG: hypothetical protein KC635_28330 [Myxococcales bacterium]|nr:hypothetical protein [Myxococcales bacterium]MCB9598493.1 hypothetical protein [Sandaracinaceae bacterium]MCB9733297.1 hypothetical protein [Deltaproteobacteria bacterium]
MPGFTLPLPVLADAWFPTKKKQIPHNFKPPMGKTAQDHYAMMYGHGAGKVKLFSGMPSAPSPYYWNASPNKAHKDSAKDVSESTKKFVHDALDKFKQCVDMWKLQAEIKVNIMSVSGIGPPGSLKGPELKSLAPFSSWEGTLKEKNEKAYAKAVVEGTSKQWKAWQDKVMIPGLPFWPAFAAFPLATAPPMPNIPMPLITCPSAMMAEMTMPKLRDAMADALDGGVKDKDEDKKHLAIFETIAFPISLNFLLWLVMQQVMNLLGKGPIPTYAPPYVPVGPVVAGSEAMGKALMA